MTPVELVLSKLPGVKRTPNGWEARCPAHDDRHASLSVAEGDDGRALLHCHAGCNNMAVCRAMGVPLSNLFPRPSNHVAAGGTSGGRIAATYDYVDAAGTLLYQVVRFEPKGFRQRRPDPERQNNWTWNLNGTKRVLYRLPELLAGDPRQWVFVVEGEKDADRLAEGGLIATTCPQGAGKWSKLSDDSALHGRRVAIVPDRDAPGRAHAQDIARRLQNRAAEVRVVELPGKDGVKDVSDWLDAGATADHLLRLADESPKAGHPAWQIDPKDPLETARQIVKQDWSRDGLRVLHHHGGIFHQWAAGAYRPADPQSIRAYLWQRLADAVYLNHRTQSIQPVKPNQRMVNDVADACRAVCHLPVSHTAPCWLGDDHGLPPADETLAMPDGMLHLPTRAVYPPDPRFWTHSALGFNASASGSEATAWFKFLGEVFQDDPESIDALQEWFGLMLLPDTRHQKILLVVGPKRSGKGTITRVLTALLGAENVCAPTLASLSTSFGLAPLIGKLAAIVSDARLGGRADQATIAEHLLSISGEDVVTVDRKYNQPWTGRLSTRFVVMTNELPRLADSSGALAGRFIVLNMTRSFYGREDLGLAAKLLAELPGVFNWSLGGYDRMHKRGYLRQPESAREALAELEDLGSPVGAFIRDRCVVGQGQSVSCADVYEEWKSWCIAQGRNQPGTAQTFGRNIRAATPGLKITQPRTLTGRIRTYEGLGLN